MNRPPLVLPPLKPKRGALSGAAFGLLVAALVFLLVYSFCTYIDLAALARSTFRSFICGQGPATDCAALHRDGGTP